MAQVPPVHSLRQATRQVSTDPHNDLVLQVDHYVGIDVGTGSARACIIDIKGDIVGLASENIGLWQPEHGFYVSALQASSNAGKLTMLSGTIYQRHLEVHLRLRPQSAYTGEYRSIYSSRHRL